MGRAWVVLCVALCAAGETDAPLWTETPAVSARADGQVTSATFAELAKAVAPAVVNITTSGAEAESLREVRDLFGLPPTVNVGSGFVLRADGLLLTNYHVIAGAREIRVRTAEHEEFLARVVGADERTDLALLKIDAPHPLPVASLGDSDEARIGEWVVAIGNPLGLEQTVTAGIVSAKGRRQLPVEGTVYQDFIQTDASINPGNSGGPLLNLRGQVVGINTAVNRAAQGIGFATPINMAKALLPALYRDGHVRRSWLGVVIEGDGISVDLQAAFHLPDRAGALVNEVLGGSPALAAGLRPGDVIVELDGRSIARPNDLPWRASLVGVGRTVDVVFVRDGKRQRASVRMVDAPGDAPPGEAPGGIAACARVEAPHGSIGLQVADLTDELVRELRLGDVRGVLVTTVQPGCGASRAGLGRGDVILEVEGRAVKAVDDYFEAMKAVKPGQIVRMLVRHAGGNRWIAFAKG